MRPCVLYLNFSLVLAACSNFRQIYVAADEEEHWNPRDWRSWSFPDRSKARLSAKLPFQGYSFAGRAQFPWIVNIVLLDITDAKRKPEWSIGNLVSSRFVLSTCLATADWERVAVRKHPRYGSYYQQFVRPKNPSEWKILYSDDFIFKTIGRGDITGTRYIKHFWPHPKCTPWIYDYQFGFAEMYSSVYPNTPWLTMAPIEFNVSAWTDYKKAYTAWGFTLPEPRCTIGTWGRPINDSVFNTLSYELDNYKIKYTVEHLNPGACYSQIRLYSTEFHGGPLLYTIECMGIFKNESTGAICDRDRGAPIVCDGYVRAIVLAGAAAKFCSNSYPLPFMVIDIRYAFGMWAEIDSSARNLTNLPLIGRWTDIKGKSTGTRCGPPNFLLHFYGIITMMSASKI